MTARRLFQIVGWLCVLAIVALSVVAPRWRPVTFVPHNLEHAAIFAVTGFVLGLGYPGRLPWRMAMLVVFAAVIELAQLFVPGRHARLIDFVVDAFGACAGLALAALIVRLWPSRR